MGQSGLGHLWLSHSKSDVQSNVVFWLALISICPISQYHGNKETISSSIAFQCSAVPPKNQEGITMMKRLSKIV